MMEGIATVGGPDFPQTAINIDGLGWSNNGGGWSIDTLDDGTLPENLHPPDGEHQQVQAGKFAHWLFFISLGVICLMKIRFE